MSKPTSVFTILPEIEQRTIAKNKTAFAFLTNTPITPGHTLIAPIRVVASVNELTDEEWQGIRALTMTIQDALKQAYGAEGFNYAWNQGADYGQSVPHFHLHIVPRTPSDDGITDYEPREFLYRPGSRESTPENELAAIAKELSAKINS